MLSGPAVSFCVTTSIVVTKMLGVIERSKVGDALGAEF